ncbi:hypothetical protein CDD82_3813 [Ophiocordyceps australis]|uniref:Uncharacterized protein n=1 Tax=Ophiocordyceps australis TaxID=1399860 RepID=A0A2C5Y785_9HYPO|nr:hypothetical protein CDD82_3813 [Ophiocordyceps australis]
MSEGPSPAPEQAMASPRVGGRGGRRGGRRGRARGRGGRGANQAASRPKPLLDPDRAVSGRGRIKKCPDAQSQAAYDRAREIRACFKLVGGSAKTATLELIDRNVKAMLADGSAQDCHPDVIGMKADLDRRLQHKLAMFDNLRRLDAHSTDCFYKAQVHSTENEFENRLDDAYEEYYDGLLNQLRVLEALHSKNLPIDIRDDRFQYHVIDDDTLDNRFGAYVPDLTGPFVPCPHRIPGTLAYTRYLARKEEQQEEKVREKEKERLEAKEKAAKAEAEAAKSHTGKRKGKGQPGGRAKRARKATRASTLNDEVASQTQVEPSPAPELTGADEEASGALPTSTQSNTPVPDSAPAANSVDGEVEQPCNADAADEEVDFRFDIGNSRKRVKPHVLVPSFFELEPPETVLMSSAATTDFNISERRKLHFQQRKGANQGILTRPLYINPDLGECDYTSLPKDELAQDLMARHALHPQYGFFLSTSSNESQAASPYVMPGNPVVYIAKPSGRTVHSSRSFMETSNKHSVEELPMRRKMGKLLRTLCAKHGVSSDKVRVDDVVEPIERLRAKSLGVAQKEPKVQPLDEEATGPDYTSQETNDAPDESVDDAGSGLSTLALAVALTEAEASSCAAPTAANTIQYDAIRDVFMTSKLSTTPEPSSELGLHVLAEVSNIKPRAPGGYGQDVSKAPLMTSHDETTAHGEIDGPNVVDDRLASRHEYASSSTLWPHSSQRSFGHLEQPMVVPQTPNSEPSGYAMQSDHGMHHMHPQDRLDEYHGVQQPPPSIHDRNGYYHSSYPPLDPRDMHMTPGRPADGAMGHAPMTAYGGEAQPPPPTYTYGQHSYWCSPSAPMPPVTGVTHHHYPPPPPPPPATLSHSRMPFSQNASAEPLPPLRPSRRRTQSAVDDGGHDAMMRQSVSSAGSGFYGPAPLHAYPGAYGEPVPPPPPSAAHPPPPPTHPPQPMAPDRMMHKFVHHHPPHGFMSSTPQPGFTQHAISPTFRNAHPMTGQMAPAETPPGPLPRMASTGDAANIKYRKLQPAPVPAHRAWSSKPELKTIFYDHKETGAVAALPNSGPTQIRGWNNLDEKPVETAPRRIRIKLRITKKPTRKATLPPLRENIAHLRPDASMVAAKKPAPGSINLDSLLMYGFGAIPTIGSALPMESASPPASPKASPPPVATQRQAAKAAGGKKKASKSHSVVTASDSQSGRPIKKRLR